jgi:hypothetical protein
MQPSTVTSVHPVRIIRDGELRISATLSTPIRRDVKSQFETEATCIKQYVGWVNGEVNEFNRKLEGTALSAVKARREKVRADEELVGSLGPPAA